MKRRQLTRRSVHVSIAGGLATLTAGCLGGGDDSECLDGGDNSEYDVIEVDPGEQRDIYVEDETFENTLIDMTADNCTAKMEVDGNSTIQNVGWLGQPDYNDSGDFLMLISGGGDVTVENCYMNGMGDGSPGTYHGGMYLSVGFSGHVEARNNYIAGMGNNAFYANSPAQSNGGGGTIAFRNCFHENNTPSNFRPGATGSTIENCLSIADDPNGERGRYFSSDYQFCRPIWHWDGTPMEVQETCLYVNPNDVQPGAGFQVRNQHGDADHVQLDALDCYVNDDIPTLYDQQEIEGSADVSFTNLTSEPTATILEDGGVPLSAEQAASGDRTYPDPFNEGIDPR